VRQAYEQGLLKQKELNDFQFWALAYWIYMDRRTDVEDRHDQIEEQCFHLNYDRWYGLYHDRFFGPEIGIPGEEQEIPVTSVDELDQFMADLEKKHFMNGSELDQRGWLLG
jgi:hypothetical protein